MCDRKVKDYDSRKVVCLCWSKFGYHAASEDRVVWCSFLPYIVRSGPITAECEESWDA